MSFYAHILNCCVAMQGGKHNVMHVFYILYQLTPAFYSWLQSPHPHYIIVGPKYLSSVGLLPVINTTNPTSISATSRDPPTKSFARWSLPVTHIPLCNPLQTRVLFVNGLVSSPEYFTSNSSEDHYSIELNKSLKCCLQHVYVWTNTKASTQPINYVLIVTLNKQFISIV